MRLLVRFMGFLFAAGYLFFARPTSWAQMAWCALPVAAGCAWRSWAAGYLLKGKRVALGGPYAYVRNPLYLGSFVLGLGFCGILMRDPPPLSSWILWVLYVLSYGVVYPAKIRAEESELRLALGADYERYAAQVPRFIPCHGHVAGLGEQHFSPELYKRNHEYECVLGCLAVFVFLATRTIFAF